MAPMRGVEENVPVLELYFVNISEKGNMLNAFYTPVEDGTYNGITQGGRRPPFFVRSISTKLY